MPAPSGNWEISGKPNAGSDGSVGRFGWKAQQYSLARFAGEAYETEMGVPNSYSSAPREPLSTACLSLYGNAYDDPSNYGGSYGSNFGEPVFLFTEFMRYLRPPEPVESFPGASAQSIEHGGRLFTSVGCALCHTPALRTGDLSNVAAMNNTVAHLYSDLLLHHVGPRLADGIEQGAAGPDEFRTAPLWGLGQRVFLLHDGRTSNLLVAIHEHRSRDQDSPSEASAVIDRFDALSPTERQNVLNFLRSL
jgi:CxxC motif-containing protein (DUF1111 family)